MISLATRLQDLYGNVANRMSRGRFCNLLAAARDRAVRSSILADAIPGLEDHLVFARLGDVYANGALHRRSNLGLHRREFYVDSDIRYGALGGRHPVSNVSSTTGLGNSLRRRLRLDVFGKLVVRWVPRAS